MKSKDIATTKLKPNQKNNIECKMFLEKTLPVVFNLYISKIDIINEHMIEAIKGALEIKIKKFHMKNL